MTDPITPPLNLVASLRTSAPHGIRDAGVTREIWLIHNAFAAGADQELEACCDLLQELLAPSEWITGLRTARRSKPPSLKELALKALHTSVDLDEFPQQYDDIRRALEALPE